MLMLELFSLLMIITVISAQDGSVGRRVPSFIGTRGKKNEAEVAALDYESADKLDHAEDDRYPVSKRSYLGFQGTRGKKISISSEKRALGFTASRGKKYDPLVSLKTDGGTYWLMNEVPKRKFYGMRGKKLPFSTSVNMMDVRGKKRPSSSAFFGTRGKKDEPSSYLNINDGSGKSKAVKNLASIMYLLSTGSNDFSSQRSNDDSDLEMSSDVESQPQDFQWLSDGT